MKQLNSYFLTALMLLFGASILAQVENRDIDGNIYETVELGDLIWMTQNLKTTKCAESNPIPGNLYKKDWKERSLYSRVAFEQCNICPSGWRVPTKQDIKDLGKTGLTASDIRSRLKWDWESIGGSSARLHVQEATLGLYSDSDLTEVMQFGYGWTTKGGADEFFAVRCVSNGPLKKVTKTAPANITKSEVENKDLNGNVYEIVELGGKTWMTQNLKTTKCENGNSIPGNLHKNDWKERSLYSRVAFEQCNICPSGWRVPTKQDIKDLGKTGLSASDIRSRLKWDWESMGGSSARLHVQEATLGLHSDSGLKEVMQFGYGWTTKGGPDEFFAVRCVSDGSVKKVRKTKTKTAATGKVAQPTNNNPTGNNNNPGNGINPGNNNKPDNNNSTNNDKTEGLVAYYRIDNLKNPRFTKLDTEKAESLMEGLKSRTEESEKLKRKMLFPKPIHLTDQDVEMYAVKLGDYSDHMKQMMMSTAYINTEMMNPNDDSYNPTRAGDIQGSASSMPRHGEELRGGDKAGFVLIKAKDLDAANPPKKLTDWVKNNLDGIFDYSSPKLKVSVSDNNELSLCLGLGKIHTFKEQNGQLSKVRTLDADGNLIAFTRGDGGKFCVITSDGKADNTYLHTFKSSSDKKASTKLKLWDEHRQDKLKERPFPTFDYANGEYLLQYYLHMWEPGMNTNLHSGSFRLKIKGDNTFDKRTWQTSHTFGMDALHNGTDWVSVYSTDGDFFLNHPGVFIDKFGNKQKALLFSSPQRWAERGQGDAAHGQMNYFYTGLGGIAYDGKGYGVVFNNPNIKTAPANQPQNVGFVYVKDDFQSTPRRNNGDQTTVDPTGNLLNVGTSDQVVIYTEKMNTEPVNYKRKVKWISNYSSITDGFANNTDIVAVGDKFIVVWEKWAKVGQEKDSWGDVLPIWDLLGTEAAVLDQKGNVLKSKNLGKHPLNNWDEIHVRNGKATWATFDDKNFTIHINTLDTNLNLEVKKMTLP